MTVINGKKLMGLAIFEDTKLDFFDLKKKLRHLKQKKLTNDQTLALMIKMVNAYADVKIKEKKEE